MSEQLTLFGRTPSAVDVEQPIQRIKGLNYIPEYITQVQERELINKIDQEPWMNDLKRRVQHYGYKYDYKARRIDHTMRIGDLPPWGLEIGQRLCKDGYFNDVPDQLIINEYKAGQGISRHVDCEPCFEDTIISLSLGDAVVMQLINTINSTEVVKILLEPRSIIILKSDARYMWQHEIKPRKSHIYNGTKYPLKRRVSLTYRRVILND